MWRDVDEEVEHGDAIAALPLRPLQQGTPEQERRDEEAEMLQPVDPGIGQSRLIEGRSMPQPDGRSMEQRGNERIGEPGPAARNRLHLPDSAEAAAQACRHRPEHGDRAADDEKRRGDSHEDLVLDHMREEEAFSEPMERRNKSKHEQQPSESKACCLPDAHAAPDSGPMPQAHCADEIKSAGQRERKRDLRIPCPGRASLKPVYMARMGLRFAGGEEQDEENAALSSLASMEDEAGGAVDQDDDRKERRYRDAHHGQEAMRPSRSRSSPARGVGAAVT